MLTVEKKSVLSLYVAFFFSGLAALIYEVVWLKPIVSIYYSTTYVISLVLTAFMLGLGLGSRLSGKFADRLKDPVLFYSLAEILIGAYGLLLLNLFGSLPFFFDILQGISSPFWYYIFQFLTIILLLLVPTTLMGTTFPLIARTLITDQAGKTIGVLYGWNNLGAIAGSLLAGFILVPNLGIKAAVLIAAASNLIAALLPLYFYHKKRLAIILPAAVTILGLLGYFSDYHIERIYRNGIFGLFSRNFVGDKKVLFYEEGLYGNIMVTDEGGGRHIKKLVLNGQGSSSLSLNDLRVSTLLGYLPVLVRPDAKKALLIGFGTGATANILSRHFPTTTVEIDPKVLKTLPYFRMVNEGVLSNYNHRLVINDARHFLYRTRERFDVIVNHPLDPIQSYSSLLFTREFFEIVKSRLREGGIYFQWFPLYNLRTGDIRDFLYTLQTVFPQQVAFGNCRDGEVINFSLVQDGGNISTETIRMSGDTGEIIIIASTSPLTNVEKEIAANFSRLTEWDKRFLGYTSLDSPERINYLYSVLAFPQDFFTTAKFVTDNHPGLEFTVPFNMIRQSAAADGVPTAAEP